MTVFTARLSTGGMVLVHPIRVGRHMFLPCCYGYATTIRRAQGSSLHLGALWFDHSFPPERGYGYVGASRFRSRRGLYFYGRIRRSDWIPVGPTQPGWALRRGCQSRSSEEDNESGRSSESDSDGRGYGSSSSEDAMHCDTDSDDSDDRSVASDDSIDDDGCEANYLDENHDEDNNFCGRDDSDESDDE